MHVNLSFIRYSSEHTELLTEKKEATILGVKIQSSLCWDSQAEHMVAKTMASHSFGIQMVGSLA